MGGAGPVVVAQAQSRWRVSSRWAQCRPPTDDVHGEPTAVTRPGLHRPRSTEQHAAGDRQHEQDEHDGEIEHEQEQGEQHPPEQRGGGDEREARDHDDDHRVTEVEVAAASSASAARDRVGELGPAVQRIRTSVSRRLRRQPPNRRARNRQRGSQATRTVHRCRQGPRPRRTSWPQGNRPGQDAGTRDRSRQAGDDPGGRCDEQDSQRGNDQPADDQGRRAVPGFLRSR